MRIVSHPAPSSDDRTERRSPSGPLVVLVTLVLGALVLLAVARLAAARQNLLQARGDLRVARAELGLRRTAQAGDTMDRATHRLAAARDQAGAFPLAMLRPVPLLGSPARAVRAASRAGAEAVAAGRIMLRASASLPTSAQVAIEGTDLTAFHAAAARSRQALERAAPHLAAARRALAGPAGAALPMISDPAVSMRAEIDRNATTLRAVSRGVELLSRLTDADADLRLLVLAQDALELRPTGGYIGSYGVLAFKQGTVRLERYDATDALPRPDPPPAPPPDLASALPGPWALSNVNWWPDFPTTAAAARDMFQRQGGGEVDGVLALTELATARLIGAVGPLQVPGYHEPVVESGFDRRAVYEVELKRPLDVPKKRFLIELADVLFARLFSLPSDRLPNVTSAIDRSIAAGDIQLWFADARLEALIGDAVVAGRLPRARHDFLMVVDANLTASKANLGVVKDVTYRVRRDREGRIRARLTVKVRDELGASAVNPYYHGYVRVYAPLGARLERQRPGQRSERALDGPFRVFSQRFRVDPRSREVLTFDYELPGAVAPGGRYELIWLRQSGTPRDVLESVVQDGSEVADPAQRRFEFLHTLGGG